jgi:hypothetical protein
VTDHRSPAPKHDSADSDARSNEPSSYTPSPTGVRQLNPANPVMYPVGGDHVVELLHERGHGRIRVRVLDAAEHEDWNLYAPGTIYDRLRSHFSDSPSPS